MGETVGQQAESTTYKQQCLKVITPAKGRSKCNAPELLWGVKNQCQPLKKHLAFAAIQ